MRQEITAEIEQFSEEVTERDFRFQYVGKEFHHPSYQVYLIYFSLWLCYCSCRSHLVPHCLKEHKHFYWNLHGNYDGHKTMSPV